MTERIQEKLTELEAERGIRILYACESGSRAWGFASADSDFDVRFIYAWPKEQYLAVLPPDEHIERGVDSENFDLAGWDLRKSLRLFQRSNAVVFEWLHSPLVYRDKTKVTSVWRDLAVDYFVPAAAAAHYAGLCKKMWLGAIEQGNVTAKKYLYGLRAYFSLRWILEKRELVPVAFAELRSGLEIEPELNATIDALIAAKSAEVEKAAIERIPIFDHLLEHERGQLEEQIATLPDECGELVRLDKLFRQVLSDGF